MGGGMMGGGGSGGMGMMGGGGMMGVGGGTPPSPVSRWTAWTTPDRQNGVGYGIGTVILVSSEPFRQIGHSLFTLLIAALAGIYARHIFDSRAVRSENSRPSA
jgi:hypothetical protein